MATVESIAHTHVMDALCPWSCPAHPSRFPSARTVPRYEDQTGAVTPSISAERKATPVYSGVLRYFPDAIAAVARLSKKGNDKHNPGEPLHWSRGKSNDHADCIVRHQMTPDELDPEVGELHAVMVAWRALAQLQILEEKRLGKADPVNPYFDAFQAALRK